MQIFGEISTSFKNIKWIFELKDNRILLFLGEH